jgi:hypothetical protein
VLALRKRKITPEVDRLAREEVLHEAREGKTAERPWDERIRSRRDAIRQRYLDYAAELQGTGAARDREFASQIRQFVEEMPAMETRRHVLKKELLELSKSRRRDTEQGADRRADRRGDERSK